MGVSATGERHVVRPRTVPILFVGFLLVVAALVYLYGPPLVPGLHNAAKERCNELTGSNFRSYDLEWKLPTWHDRTLPHWECYDTRHPEELGRDLGWWVNPF